MRQSIQASAPSSWGEPVSAGLQATSANLSCPLRAKVWPRCSWSADKTLAQNASDVAIDGQLLDDFPGAIAISGGVNDSEKNDWQVNPVGPPGVIPVMTTTPLAK